VSGITVITSLESETLENSSRDQMNLFALVDLPKDPKENYSNSIVSLHDKPRFVRGKNPHIPVKSNDKDNLIVEHVYKSRTGEDGICQIEPVLIRKKIQGKTVEFYAYQGDREEVIEQVLFMLACKKGLTLQNQAGGIPRWGIEFSIYEIREELKKIKKTKPYDVILESLFVLTGSKVSLTETNGKKKKRVTLNAYVDSKLEQEGLGRGRDKMSVAFSDFVVKQIEDLNYRQYNFGAFLRQNTTLSAFILTHLLTVWRNANVGSIRAISTIEIMEKFGKNRTSIVTKRRDMRKALESLVGKGFFTHIPHAKKIIHPTGENDYLFHVECTSMFREQLIISLSKHKGLRTLQGKLDDDPDYQIPLRRNLELR
jgi:hypothetical protein